MMQLIDKVKKIETYICECFEEWDLDDPVEEGYLEDYQDISGASEEEFQAFEEIFGIRLSSDFKELYSYKNGSKFFSILPCVIDQRDLTFSLMNLQEIETCKKYFQNRDALLTEFPDYFSSQDLENMHDSRIKPYLFNKKWLPFAQYCDSCYLMLDFDPDQVIYAAESLTNLIEGIMDEIV